MSYLKAGCWVGVLGVGAFLWAHLAVEAEEAHVEVLAQLLDELHLGMTQDAAGQVHAGGRICAIQEAGGIFLWQRGVQRQLVERLGRFRGVLRRAARIFESHTARAVHQDHQRPLELLGHADSRVGLQQDDDETEQGGDLADHHHHAATFGEVPLGAIKVNSEGDGDRDQDQGEDESPAEGEINSVNLLRGIESQ